ncbi:MAG: hypothetical protein OIF55_19125 [Amphritea sp.]|nr:hypothetical protein [Amphritea sp.]
MTDQEPPWNRLIDSKPSTKPKSKKRFMVYHPIYTGYAFRCWYEESAGFGCDEVQSMISNVTHWRPAGHTEKSRQLSMEKIAQINMQGGE